MDSEDSSRSENVRDMCESSSDYSQYLPLGKPSGPDPAGRLLGHVRGLSLQVILMKD